MNLTQLLSPTLADISRHPLAVLLLIAAWWAFSGAVDYLPAPVPMGSKWYAAFYGAAHAVCGNVRRLVAGGKKP